MHKLLLLTIYAMRRGIQPECDISIDFDMKEYPNLFVSRKRYKNIRIYPYENFHMDEYPNIFVPKFDTNVYLNIFVSGKLVPTNIRIYF